MDGLPMTTTPQPVAQDRTAVIGRLMYSRLRNGNKRGNWKAQPAALVTMTPLA